MVVVINWAILLDWSFRISKISDSIYGWWSVERWEILMEIVLLFVIIIQVLILFSVWYNGALIRGVLSRLENNTKSVEDCGHNNTVRINGRDYCDDCSHYLPLR